MDHPLFEIVTTRMGAVSIRNKAVNEIMHNPVGPWIEANTLYIDQSDLRENLKGSRAPEFILFDVGLGAAANALAALACVRSLGNQARPFRMVSFERDLELLRFALQHAGEFEHFRGFEHALEQLLNERCWNSGQISWELREGNFLDLIEQETHRPHMIFFDPYSPKVNNEMWTLACFTKIRRKCRESADGGTSLFTYSRATKIRVALLAAGFHVGVGAATGAKDETTVAASCSELLRSPLDQAWFERWRNSHDHYPFDIPESERSKIDSIIKEKFGG